jgi:predicted secreted protein
MVVEEAGEVDPPEASQQQGDKGGRKSKKPRHPSSPRPKGPNERPRASQTTYRENYDPALDVRGFQAYSARNRCQFCPRTSYKRFMTQIDNIIRLSNMMDKIRDEMTESTNQVYRSYGTEPPCTDEQYATRRKHYVQTIQAYHGICKALREPGVKNDPKFELLIASLEVVGCIILNPRLLSWISYGYQDQEFQFPFLETTIYTTQWTQDRIDKMSWCLDGNGVTMHTVKKDSISFCNEED